MTLFRRCSQLANPLTACLTGCGIITSLMGLLTMSTFAPMAATTYVSDFTKYSITAHSIKCIDSTNKGNYYDIAIPNNTPDIPPTMNQTTIPTLYIIDNIFIRPPYYELHVQTSTATDPTPKDVVYSMRYKFMNQCGELGDLLVRNFIWNGTKGYVYVRGSDTYPFAFPTYDIILPYAVGTSVILLGVIFFISACCAGTAGCPLHNWASGRRIGNVQSGAPATWSTV